MQMIVNTGISAEDHYEILDLSLTQVLEAAGVTEINDETMAQLIQFNRSLRIALGLPVEVAS